MTEAIFPDVEHVADEGPDSDNPLAFRCTSRIESTGGPIESLDTNWQIGLFSIARYNSQGFLKACGNVVNPFDVLNTATASGTDSFAVVGAALTQAPGRGLRHRLTYHRSQ